jgi:hypothetical protein
MLTASSGELADALSSVHNIFTDYHRATALLRFAQALTSLKLALAPPFDHFRQLLLRLLGRIDQYAADKDHLLRLNSCRDFRSLPQVHRP